MAYFISTDERCTDPSLTSDYEKESTIRQDALKTDTIQLCGPCSVLKKKCPAIYLCQLCDDELLCEACSTLHKAQKWTKSHELSKLHLHAGTNKQSMVSHRQLKDQQAKEETIASSNLDITKPGKPTEVNVSFGKIQLRWTWPAYMKAKDFFQIEYKENIRNGKWIAYNEELTTCTCVLTNLKPGSKYFFRVRVVNEDYTGPYSEQSDVVELPMSYASELVGFCVCVSQKSTIPIRYRLPLNEVKEARNIDAKTRKFILGDDRRKPYTEKTLMLVGETGTGKSTLVDGMANYILGVEWGDPYRFQLVGLEADEKAKLNNQAISQTEWITCYTIHPHRGSRYPYTVNIIDTPGFGDTRGIDRDDEIVSQIRKLFTSKLPKGVIEIDAVCFLIKAPDARLTAIQSYIFEKIMSLFGKDIEDNICSLITFADGDDPPVYAALEQSGLPFGERFTFNNSGLFVNNKSPTILAPIFWQMGVTSFKNFFSHVNTLSRKSLLQTGTVLNERKRIEATLENLQPTLNAALNVVKGLKDEIHILEKHKSTIADNKDFTYTVDDEKQVKTPLAPGENITTCTHCHFTCHMPCGIPLDADKYNCSAMSGGNCTVCPKSCDWTKHQNTPYYYTYVPIKVTKKYAEMEQKFLQAHGEIPTQERLLESKRNELRQKMDAINKMMEIVKISNERLGEIALCPNPLTMAEHIRQMIENEKLTKKKGFENRMEILYKLLERTKIPDTVHHLQKELKNVGVEEKNNYSLLTSVYRLFGFELP